MSRRSKEQQPWQNAPYGAHQDPQRPQHRWRAVRKAAMGKGAPASVRVVLDHIVETLALNRNWKVIKLGYGRHSARERAWDHRRRGELVADAVIRRRDLVQLPDPEKEGFAERCDLCRRTVIRVGRWLQGHGLAHIYHEQGSHEVPDKYGTMHRIGRGGCVAGGKGAAGVWLPGSPTEPEPEPEPEPPPTPPEDRLARLARIRREAELAHQRESAARGP